MKMNSRSGMRATYPYAPASHARRCLRPAARTAPTRPKAEMTDASNVTKNLRDRLGTGTEDRLGRALGELLESPLLTGAIGRAFDARETAVQAQEVAMGALNLPSAADVERLTRRLRSVSQRLEGIEDAVDRLDQRLGGVTAIAGFDARLAAIDESIGALGRELGALREALPDGPNPVPREQERFDAVFDALPSESTSK